MSDRTAVLVTGPESSGTRLWTELLIRCAGLWGDSGHEQRMDRLLTAGEQIPAESCVIRRSVPHGEHWPNLEDILWSFKVRGYEGRMLVCERDRRYVAASQVARQQHAFTLAHAHKKIDRALASIREAADLTGCLVVRVEYELLMLGGADYAAETCLLLGLNFDRSQMPALVDGNAKWKAKA